MRSIVPSRLHGIVTPVNPFGSEADRHTVAWATAFQLMPSGRAASRLSDTRPGALAAHCYPNAGRSDLCLIADWMTWLFLLDDLNDEGAYGRRPEDLEQMLSSVFFRSPAQGRDAGDEFGAALADIVGRLGGRMLPAWRNRFLKHVADYFVANVWQAAHRRAGEVPDIDVFPRMRRDAGAVMPSFDLIEFAAAATLPAGVYYSRIYQRLLAAAADVVCWTNDLMTLEKEIAHGDTHNLVCVVSATAGMTLEQAIDDVVARTDRRIEVFLTAERELDDVLGSPGIPGEAALATRRCVATLRAWMRGHVEWGRTTARYAGPVNAEPITAEPITAEPIKEDRAP